MKAHCPACGGERNAHIRATHRVDWDNKDDPTSASATVWILQCAGCDTLFFRKDFWFSEWETPGHHPVTGELQLEGGVETTYWPSPTSRKPPDWVDRLQAADRTLGQILTEMYSALNTDLRVLAAIGIRTAFDRASEFLGVAAEVSFKDKLAALASSGKIGSEEQDTLSVLIDAGSAAAHRAWRPTITQLSTMTDLLEGFLHRSFVLGDGVKKLRASIPARAKKAKKPRGKARSRQPKTP